jgi:hypothetical protein
LYVDAQRGLWIAGYSNTRELLTIHSYSYRTNKPVWEIDFFEHLFANEPLLADKSKIKGTFICSSRAIVIPAELYEKREAESWLKRLYLIESGDEIITSGVDGGKYHHVMGISVNVPALIKINFTESTILPYPVHHFTKGEGITIRCSVLPDQSYVTIYDGDKLLWHQLFDHTAAEDIAFNINHFARESNIDLSDAKFLCESAAAVEYGIIRNLATYFHGITDASGNKLNNRWDAAIALANHLIACV